MKRKKSDVVQLSKIRMREELRAKLARDAERNDRTLNGEIVDRLEKSYQAAAYLAEVRQRAHEAAEANRQIKEHAAELRRMEEKLRPPAVRQAELSDGTEEIYLAAKVIDVLLGADKMKSELLRSIALEVAVIPAGWFSTFSRRQLLERLIPRLEPNGGSQP